MGYPAIEDLLPKAGNSIYKLVRLAADRALELADGKKKLIEITSDAKTTTVALEEIKAGRVVLKEMAEHFGPPEVEEKASLEEEDEGAVASK